MQFEPAASLTEKIADHLGSEIIAGRLRPARAFRSSKSPRSSGYPEGRCAKRCSILERRYLVEILPRRGAMVSSLEAEELANCSELVTELQASFYGKLALRRRARARPLRSQHPGDAGAVLARDLDGTLEARRAYAQAGFAQLKTSTWFGVERV